MKIQKCSVKTFSHPTSLPTKIVHVQIDTVGPTDRPTDAISDTSSTRKTKKGDNSEVTQHAFDLAKCSCLSGQKRLIRYMLCKEANVDLTTTQGDSALYLATFGILTSPLPDTTVLADLIDAGCNVNAQNNRGYTPLHRAASKGDKRVTDFLLKRGADPYICSVSGIYPINSAINAGHVSLAERLTIQLENNHVWDIVDPHTPPRISLGLQSPNRTMKLESCRPTSPRISLGLQSPKMDNSMKLRSGTSVMSPERVQRVMKESSHPYGGEASVCVQSPHRGLKPESSHPCGGQTSVCVQSSHRGLRSESSHPCGERASLNVRSPRVMKHDFSRPCDKEASISNCNPQRSQKPESSRPYGGRASLSVQSPQRPMEPDSSRPYGERAALNVRSPQRSMKPDPSRPYSTGTSKNMLQSPLGEMKHAPSRPYRNIKERPESARRHEP